jgi:hypothetical protein
MSCGCSSTTTPSSSTSCGGCGYQCNSCICPADPIVMPTVTCPDPVACDEIFPLECIEYSGDDIKCSTTATTLYPNVTHVVATNGDSMTNVLNNINSQLCYLFSADYISRMLTNIKDTTELKNLFCVISNSCTAITQLICPTVASVTYYQDTATNQYYLIATTSYVPFATSYVYQFYTETTYNSGIFDIQISGASGTITQPSSALPITFNSLISAPTTYTSSKNYAVLVYVPAAGGYTANGQNPATNTTFTYSSLNPSGVNCGINKYVATSAELECMLINLNGKFSPLAAYSKALQFTFTQEPSNPLYVSVVSYKVNWYLKVLSPTISYENQGDSGTLNYVSGALETINLYKSSVTKSFTKTSSTTAIITSTAHGLVPGMLIKIDTAVSGQIIVGTYPITYLTPDTFSIVTTISSSIGPTPVIYKSQMNPTTDSAVVMIYTSATSECFKGVQNPLQTYTDAQMTSLISNVNNNVFKYP